MTLACKLLAHDAADGPRNMALDEALLDAAAANPGLAFFRTYEWTEPTLSLGYFQSIGEGEADPRFHGVPVVRRSTGGGAIWHHHEVTYALVLPVDHPAARRGGPLYHEVHAAIARVFQGLGARVERRGGSTSVGTAPRPFLCFTDRDPEDLVLDGSKVVGSAQRRRGSAVLQHGSVLLRRSPRVPELPGAGDLAPLPTELAPWAEALRREVPQALGLHPEPAGIPLAESRRADVLERTVYRNPAWTRRR